MSSAKISNFSSLVFILLTFNFFRFPHHRCHDFNHYSINKYGEIGSPCFVPRPTGKKLVAFPLFIMQLILSLTRSLIHFIKLTPKLKCVRTAKMKLCSMESNAFSKSAAKSNKDLLDNFTWSIIACIISNGSSIVLPLANADWFWWIIYGRRILLIQLLMTLLYISTSTLMRLVCICIERLLLSVQSLELIMLAGFQETTWKNIKIAKNLIMLKDNTSSWKEKYVLW